MEKGEHARAVADEDAVIPGKIQKSADASAVGGDRFIMNGLDPF